jgi:hypothetical protein
MQSPNDMGLVREYAETGSELVGETPENFARFTRAEAEKWGRIVKQSGATVD